MRAALERIERQARDEYKKSQTLDVWTTQLMRLAERAAAAQSAIAERRKPWARWDRIDAHCD